MSTKTTTQPSDPSPFARFSQAMKSILNVSKEEVEKQEKEAQATKIKIGKKRYPR